jgi:hypothetical protein
MGRQVNYKMNGAEHKQNILPQEQQDYSVC